MSLVTTEWLEKNINEIKLLECSWHMPSISRDPYEEFLKDHIKGSIYFDLEKYSDLETDLPHMLPSKHRWENIVSGLGIKNNDLIIIYDNSDVLSACRCWYNFIYFGHDPKLVKILNGGFKKWKRENRKTTSELLKVSKSNYRAIETKYLVKNKQEIILNTDKEKFKVIDARSKDRFEGKVAEPRANLKSGSIRNSICLPFKEVINEDNTFKTAEEISSIFLKIIDIKSDKVVFSCGSGITACVLALAYSIVNNKYLPVIYDGSWAEYGKI